MYLQLLLIISWLNSCILASNVPLAFVQPSGGAGNNNAYKSDRQRTPRKLPPSTATEVLKSLRMPFAATSSASALFMAAVGDNEFYKGQDCYQVLDVPRSADAKTIKSAYRKAIGTWHPDKFPDDEKKRQEGGIRMEAINRAWFCLGDEDRRRRYDQYGEAGVGTSYVFA